MSKFTAELVSFLGRVERSIRYARSKTGEDPLVVVVHPETVGFILEESGNEVLDMATIWGVPVLLSTRVEPGDSNVIAWPPNSIEKPPADA